MKTYAEFLRGFIGKKGILSGIDGAWYFIINRPNTDAQLVDVGTDYAEFLIEPGQGDTQRFVPTSSLTVSVFRQ